MKAAYVGRKRGVEIMCKIIRAVANENYTVTIEFEGGSSIIYNMQKHVKTLPFVKLKDLSSFEQVKFDEKSIYWEEENDKKNIIPFRLSIDNILFSLRE
jgi:hypothetical protein